MTRKPAGTLKRGWTTGACATAAVRAAYTALLTGRFPDPVEIVLPKGERPAFPLALEGLGEDWAQAGVVKDAGDDPDVTHGALIIATLRRLTAGSGLVLRAGSGVGTVTRAGLPVPVGQPAINPVPRRMITETIEGLARTHGDGIDLEVELSIPGGEDLAKRTWNPRLGIVGGLSILGTTGVVHPFSCAAWIHSIHRGIDVARAAGQNHVAGCTGSTSERTVQRLYRLPDFAMLDMGDFAGGLLKYLRRYPIPRLTIGGGFAKMTKLAQGFLDLHSGRSQVDFDWLATQLEELGATPTLVTQARQANTANQVLGFAQAQALPLGARIAERAQSTARTVVEEAGVSVEVMVIDRHGSIVGRSHD